MIALTTMTRCSEIRCVLLAAAGLALAGCNDELTPPAADALQPRVVTEATRHDTDDPAIWVNAADPSKSLVLGTDKDTDGSLYAFDLAGKIVARVEGLQRPNNVDVVSGFALGGKTVDLAVVTEREQQRLRAFTLPDLRPADRVSDPGQPEIRRGDREGLGERDRDRYRHGRRT
jgi:3-phytase